MDAELYDGKAPPIWLGAAGPRMLGITGREADGWWPAGSYTPEDYAAKLKVIHEAAESVGRDPQAITPAITQMCLIGDEGEVAEMLETPMVKSIVLMINASDLRQFGYDHPMGPTWNGIMDFDPVKLSRDKIIKFCDEMDPQAIRAILPCGTPKQVAARMKGFVDAGLRVFKLMEYGSMGGLKFMGTSAAKIRETEDELLRLCGEEVIA
jgi:phthiodiolone/phenolphthiodiolone dimycocerosates ketoreductase